MSERGISARFASIESPLKAVMTPDRRALLDRIASIEPRRRGRGFTDWGANVVAALKEAAATGDEKARRDFSRALIARLATTTLARASTLRLTAGILERTESWLRELADFLEGPTQGDRYWFPGDWFCKDYRFVTMLSVPCGARVVDLHERVTLKTALKLAVSHPAAGLRAWPSIWFRAHTETRNLDEFNEEGWRNCCREIAKLLETHPNVAGLVATSWFYDPALAAVSPRLAYLRQFPVAHGAMLVRHGTTRFDIRSATARSATRKALYESGKYQPVAWSILWERRELIEWANSGS